MVNGNYHSVVLGGGLTGLAAGYVLSGAGCAVGLFEQDDTVGGLSKTVVRGGFRFDLGGHRFFSKDETIDRFVRDLMQGELVLVPRKSKIYLRGKYFDYPLKALNAMFGMGIATTAKIIADYLGERIRHTVKETEKLSLEDWVVSHFGRTMFDIYFKEYSEKVWGIDCKRISVDWVAQRIRGLSLAAAIKNAVFKFSGRDIPSLVDQFIYPELGIGRIADRLKEEIEKRSTVTTGARVERVLHTGACVEAVEVRTPGGWQLIEGEEFISSIPLPQLVRILDPAPPADVIRAASELKFRDLVVVALMIDRKRVTDLTWLYIPEQKIPFGRIHEPTNWSEKMAPPGKTVLVMEFFCFKGDRIWNETDERLIALSAEHLERLGFITRKDVIDGMVVRAPKAYPLFEIGYAERSAVLYDYLGRFENLHIAGRVGKFRYYNMDHAIASGMEAAEQALKHSAADAPAAKRKNGKRPLPAAGPGKCAAH
ncbi:MAG: FAD-dependent oxidoreductase [Nitrospirota bacterium]